MHTPTSHFILAALLALAPARPLTAADRATVVAWGNSPDRNMVMQGHNLPVELDESNTLWSVDADSYFCYSQPVVIGDRMIIGMSGKLPMPHNDDITVLNHSQVRCFDLETGEQNWVLALGQSRYGVCATFAVEENRLYFIDRTRLICIDLGGMADGNQGVTNELEHASRARTSERFKELPPTALPEGVPWGDILWVLELNDYGVRPHDAGSGTPLILGDQVWVSTSHANGVLPSPASAKGKEGYEEALAKGPNKSLAPNVVVADKMTGQLLAWDRSQIPQVYHGQWGSLAAGEVNGETQVFWGDGYGFMHAFRVPEIPAAHTGDPIDLEKIWWADGNPHEYRYAEDGSERQFPIGGYKAPENILRKTGPAHYIGTPVFHNGKVYAAIGRDRVYNYTFKGRALGPGALTCFDPTGRGNVTDTHIVWQNTEIGRTQSSVSIKDGVLYLGSLDGHLYCLDPETGALFSSVDLEHGILERSQMVTDGKIYVGTHGGSMYTLSEGPQPEVLWHGRFRPEVTTVTPVGDILLMGSHREFFAFRKDAGPEAAVALDDQEH